MTSFRTPLRLIGAVLVLLVVLQSAYAQTYEGETPVDMARGMADENGDIVRFRSLTIKWRFAGLMGEPLRQFAGRYEHHSPPWVELAGAPVCFAQHVVASFSPHKIEPDMVSEGALDEVDLYTHSRFRMIIEPNSNLGFALGPSNVIQHYFGVDSFSQGTDYGPSVPGSPEWDRLFQVGPVGSEDISWLSEAQARELFRVGFSVSRIDMVEPKYALAQVKASYERHFRSKPCGDRPVEPLAEDGAEGDDEGEESNPEQVAGDEDAAPEQPEPQTAADRLDAMLNRVAEAREKAKEDEQGTMTDVVSDAARQAEAETSLAGMDVQPTSDTHDFKIGGDIHAKYDCEAKAQDANRTCSLFIDFPNPRHMYGPFRNNPHLSISGSVSYESGELTVHFTDIFTAIYQNEGIGFPEFESYKISYLRPVPSTGGTLSTTDYHYIDICTSTIDGQKIRYFDHSLNKIATSSPCVSVHSDAWGEEIYIFISSPTYCSPLGGYYSATRDFNTECVEFPA